MSESRLCENGVAGCRGFCAECRADTRYELQTKLRGAKKMGGIVTDKDIAETMRKLAERQAQDSAKMPAPVEMHKFASGAKSTVVMPRFDLIPLEALILLAERFGYGASRHGERNYRNGANDPEFIRDRKNHMFRHVVLFMEHNRPEDLGAVLCNAAILADIGAHKTDGDETLRKEAR